MDEFLNKNLKSLPLLGDSRKERINKMREICGSRHDLFKSTGASIRAWQQAQDKKDAIELSTRVMADNGITIARQEAMIAAQASTTDVHMAEIRFQKKEIERLKKLLADNNIESRKMFISS